MSPSINLNFPLALAALRRWLLATLALAVMTLAALAQESGGTVMGVVIGAWDGAPLAGVVVTVRGTTLAAQSDASGRYELKNVPPGDQVLRFSKPGFAAAVVTDARVLLGQTTSVNGNLRPEFYEMEEYEVTAEEFNDQTENILADRQNSAAMIHSIGSEMFSKLGASTAADAATKVSGTTIVDGKYAVVRGLNDRYVPTFLNGASVPSSDPYRRSASLDQFPSAIIEQVAISKTFTPDQPGDSTGGSINVITKQFPEKDFLDFRFGAAYNSQATGNKDYLTYSGNSGWLGTGDKSQNLPGIVGYGKPVPPARTLTSVPSNPNYNTQVEEANTLNAQTKALGKTQFAPTTSAPPPDQKLGLSLGKTYDVDGQTFAFIGALDYKREYRYDGNGTQQRIQGTNIVNSVYNDNRSLTTVAWAGSVGVAARLWKNHEIGVDFLTSQTSRDSARILSGTNYLGAPDNLTIQDKLQSQQRNLTTYQLHGKSRFPEMNDLEFDYLFATTTSSQNEPNTRFFNYTLDGTNGATGGNSLPDPASPTRYYSELEENNQQIKLDLTYPVPLWFDLEATLKGGINVTAADRNFKERQIYYQGAAPWTGGDPNTYLTDDNLGYAPTQISGGRTRWNWQRNIGAFDSNYDGIRNIDAAYIMTDFPIVEKLRLIAGYRFERTEININSESFAASSITGERVNTTDLEQTDVLPAVGLIWAITDKMNLRVNYSQTLARPSFRELAAYRSYDPTLDVELEGNPNLQMSSIENYDVSWEWFPAPSSVIGIGFFYKDITLPIQQSFITLDGSIITWENIESATVTGVEFEARQRLDFIHSSLASFSVGGNYSMIQSSSDLTELELLNKEQYVPGVSKTRPLTEQSPYIINLDATYDYNRTGTILSLVYNITGPRLIAAATTTKDVYEQPAAQLDVIASQRLAKNVYLKFSAKNLLNPVRKLTYGEGTGETFSSFTTGTTYSLGVDFKF